MASNIILPQKYDMASSPANMISSDRAEVVTLNGSNSNNKNVMKENEAKPVPPAPSLRSGKGRKGSLMFTTSGTVGLGSNSIPNQSTSGPEKEMNVSVQPTSPTEHPVKDTSDPPEPQAAPVTHTMRKGGARKGSLMFTNTGTVGLGSTSSVEAKESKHSVKNYSNGVHDYTGEQPPVVYFPQNLPILDQRPITYFTQPSSNANIYNNPNGFTTPYISPPQEPQPLLSGDHFVS